MVSNLLTNAVLNTETASTPNNRILRFAAIAATYLTAFACFATKLAAEVSTSELPVLTGTYVETIDSRTVGDAFTLYVRAPPEAAANPDKSYPVIYALDGDHTFPMMCSIATELSWSGAVPPAIVVGIGYGTLDLENGNHRSRDLSPQPFMDRPESGGGLKFHEFLIEEVFPFIEANYSADPDQRYLFGHSLGGLFALYTYSKSPDDFQGIIAGSPFLSGQLELLEETAGSATPRSCKLLIVTGDEEDSKLFIDDLEPLRSKLEDGWAAPDTFDIVLLPGFDHFTMVAPSISMGLRSVFEKTPSESR